MTSETLQKLKFPAIGLIAVGILNILFGLYFLFSLIVVWYSGVTYQNFSSAEEKQIFNIGFYGVIALGVASLLLAPLIIHGALRMMRGEKLSLARISAILAMPSISFIIGIPVGIWALLAIRRAKAGENA